MNKVNAVLLVLGVALQLLLQGVLLTRRLAPHAPVFTALISFFLLRSVLLRLLAAHTDPDAYMVISATLSLLDTLLAIAVASELFRATTVPGVPRSPRMWNSWPAFLLLVVVAGAFAWGLSALVPSTPRHPVDRGVLFAAALLLAVAVRFPWGSAQPTARYILAGFVPLSLIGIAAQVGQSLAAVHRSVAAFKACAYAEPLTFLLVLLYWTSTLYRASAEKPQCLPAPDLASGDLRSISA